MHSGADSHEPQPQPHRTEDALTEADLRSEVVRLLPVSVLVVSADRYFRAAATMLLSRRGCTVLSAVDELEARDHALLAAIDVLVVELASPADQAVREALAVAELVDAATLTTGRRVAPVGVVVVGEPEQLRGQLDVGAGAPRPVLDKWGPFERLYQAIVDCDRRRSLPPRGGVAMWPASARRQGAG